MKLKKQIQNSTPIIQASKGCIHFMAYFTILFSYVKKGVNSCLNIVLGARAGYPKYAAAAVHAIKPFPIHPSSFIKNAALRGTFSYPWRKVRPAITCFAQMFIHTFNIKEKNSFFIQPIRVISFFICICTMFFALPCCKTKNDKQKVNMTPSFSPTDKNPLGLYVANQLVRQKFTDYDLYKNDQSFKAFYSTYTQYDVNRNGRIFCVMAQQFYPNEEDLAAITDFVSNGNTLFVAANYFDTTFLNRFHLKIKDQSQLPFQLAYQDNMQQTGLRMADSTQFERTLYHYYFFPLDMEISRDENYTSQPIAETQNGKTCGLVFKYGSGRVIIATNATALTNYFLLTKSNYKYLDNLLSYMPTSANSLWEDDKKKIPTTGITVDNYYNNVDEGGSGNPFMHLLKKPALAWAFWLLLLLAVFWVYNGMIRRQRIIEVIKPNTNSSVEFAETVARLYLLKRDNKNIALKMITYFLEQVRTKYYLNTSQLNMEFAKALTAKTGLSIEHSETLLQTIYHIQNQPAVSDYSLLDLNTQIQKFLKT